MDRSSVRGAGTGDERLVAVSIPATIGVIGPDVLASTAMTIVELGERSLWVEGPTALPPGEAVVLGCRLPGDASTGVAPVLAVAVVSGGSRPGAGDSWRSPLVIEQIEGADGERLAAVAAREEFRRGGGRR